MHHLMWAESSLVTITFGQIYFNKTENVNINCIIYNKGIVIHSIGMVDQNTGFTQKRRLI